MFQNFSRIKSVSSAKQLISFRQHMNHCTNSEITLMNCAKQQLTLPKCEEHYSSFMIAEFPRFESSLMRPSCAKTSSESLFNLATGELKQRFVGLNSVLSSFSLFLQHFWQHHLMTHCIRNANNCKADMTVTYQQSFQARLMLSFRACLRKDLLAKSTIHGAAELFM